jgi:hypothetical protein
LWLEPDCVPLRIYWLNELATVYYAQPKRYLGSILSSPDGKLRHLSRVAIYPRGAGGELKELCASKTPFELAAGALIVPRAGKTKLIQQLRFTAETDRASIRSEAVLIHGDKEAVLLSRLIDEASKPKQDSQHQFEGPNGGSPILLLNTAKAVNVGPPPVTEPTYPIRQQPPLPLDKRTKEYKAWKAAQPVTTQP